MLLKQGNISISFCFSVFLSFFMFLTSHFSEDIRNISAKNLIFISENLGLQWYTPVWDNYSINWIYFTYRKTYALMLSNCFRGIASAFEFLNLNLDCKFLV